MNVILLEKIAKLGGVGDTATVKSGYARNFLFPQGKAIPATRTNLAEFDQRKAELLAAHNEKIAVAQRRAAKVNEAKLTIEVNASEEGKLFGSVGTKDIASALNTQTGSDIHKSEVLMPHGVIRQLGEFRLQLDLGHEVTAHITLAVVGMGSAAKVEAGDSFTEAISEPEETADDAGETTGPAADPTPPEDAAH